MPIIDKLFPEGVCKCGRDTRIVHCPSCGSTNCERRLRVAVDFLAALNEQAKLEAKKHRWWFCKRCYLKFCDTERVACEAPQKQESIQVKRALNKTEKATEGWSEQERKAKLEELFSSLRKGENK